MDWYQQRIGRYLLTAAGSAALALGYGTGYADEAPSVGAQLDSVETTYIEINDQIEPDDAYVAYIKPYANDLNKVMNRKISESRALLEVGQPESLLGNLAADILREEATRVMGQEVHVAIMNQRGLRISIPKGDVTVRTMFELMPFENHISVLKFNGEQILQIAEDLAIHGGEPVSGMTLRIEGAQAKEVTVGGEPVDPEAHYWVATNIWMANGGGMVPTLWDPLKRVDLPVLIRDTFIEYLEKREYIDPQLDGRITLTEDES